MNIILKFTVPKKVQMIEKQVSLKKRTFTVLHEKREDRGHRPQIKDCPPKKRTRGNANRKS
jgi:hypothetical protein